MGEETPPFGPVHLVEQRLLVELGQEAAVKLGEAARTMASTPGALQLRLYQTLVEVSSEARSTIVFPVPMDLGSTMAPQATATSPAQLQAMMQSMVALASS